MIVPAGARALISMRLPYCERLESRRMLASLPTAPISGVERISKLVAEWPYELKAHEFADVNGDGAYDWLVTASYICISFTTID